MVAAINDINDVSRFFQDLFNEGVNAHPDEDFSQYINTETGEATYTDDDAIIRNHLMQRSFEVCDKSGVDIYDLMQEIYLKETGLDKFIPLPSKQYSSE